MSEHIELPFAGMPRTSEGQREMHSADGKTYVMQVAPRKWQAWFQGTLVDTFETRELARECVRTKKREAGIAWGSGGDRMLRIEQVLRSLPRAITVDSLVPVIESLGTAKEGLRHATYRAARVSPLLTAALAKAYPMTFCPHDRCILPIAHEGDHYPDDKGVFDA